MTTVLALVAFALPLGAAAAPGNGKPGKAAESYVAGDVVAEAKKKHKVRVIIQSAGGVSGAEKGYRGLGLGLGAVKRLGLVDGIAVEIPSKKLDKLAGMSGLIVTLDAPVRPSGVGNLTMGGFSSGQMWPFESGSSFMWATDGAYKAAMPAIAIVDSGIEAGRADFAGRVLADVKINQSDAGDSRGHGTFVAGIAAGSASGKAGAAPLAPLVSVDVMDGHGMAYVSDVIAGVEWIRQNKGKYNIRVANFSLHAARPASIRWDPLAQAVEKLWFSGVVVVAAAGNYGTADGPSGVVSAPGNDPFVITVGAVDIGHKFALKDDGSAPWSAWGYTLDGFSKPELGAAGRFMIGPIPPGSSLAAERSDKIVAPGYIELSGTSFAAPVVAGAAAQILARHPDWTPGQVKGALMLTTRPVPNAPKGSVGVGQIDANAAASLKTAPDANAALMAFVTSDGSGGLAFDTAAWSSAAWSSAAWSSAAWADAAWSSAAWSSAAWSSAAWSSAAWSSAAWADAAWSSAAWADVASEDNADDPAAGGVEPSAEEAALIGTATDLAELEAALEGIEAGDAVADASDAVSDTAGAVADTVEETGDAVDSLADGLLP